MKRLIIAVLMLVFLVFAAYSSRILVKTATQKVSDAFEVCTEKEKTEKLDYEKLKNAIKVWNENQKILYIFLAHDVFGRVESSLNELEYLLKNPDFEESSKLSMDIAKTLEQISEKMDLSVELIF